MKNVQNLRIFSASLLLCAWSASARLLKNSRLSHVSGVKDALRAVQREVKRHDEAEVTIHAAQKRLAEVTSKLEAAKL